MTAILSPDELRAIRERAEKATPGAWWPDGTCNDGEFAVRLDVDDRLPDIEAAFTDRVAEAVGGAA